ncbi:ArsR family transcriptional regulator [Methylobacterium gnaphalii]|uniref:Uncharacterized protein n=1 Tax=Methylobacterium gnaphalii TaxID=1010610 RepID=A0A512JPC9_9HYPH|nr:ArsR family transcriptional regulator [Methylobacterium gnaphalii]GEP11808.1 hypothetical protein MGN01_36530 [Methylobacterium gnaphalii]GJD69485.1 hypothetical protein MMMDOFMJ_2416 [Methylobacterium gnaphalii]GLS49557.1 hypothetical protein GCM10007885_24060 [Methylobacterium gnaphalii]
MDPNRPHPSVLWSVSQIAARDKVSKPTVSNHVARLVERQGLYVERDTRGRVSLVNVVQYDSLRAQFSDPSKAQAPTVEPDAPLPAPAAEVPTVRAPAKDSYDEGLRQKVWFDVEKRRLETAEIRGKLVRLDRYTSSVASCGAELARLIDALPQEADAFAVELDFDDVHRVRLALKGLAVRLRGKLSKRFESLAAGAPALDEPLGDDAEGAGDM